LGVLTAAVNHAVKWKRLVRNDVPHIELPPQPVAKERWLTDAELAKLRAAATGRTKDFIDLAYYTASRKDAVETLTWFQVDLERARINLSKPGERKTKKRRPIIPIDPALLPLLKRLYEEKTTEYVLGHSGNARRGFATAIKNAGLDPVAPWLDEKGRKLREPTTAELEEHRRQTITPHTLRHTRATHLLQAGVSPWAVANLLGDTLTTVVKTYGHHSPDFLAEIFATNGKKEDAGA
jgi:integrase